MGGKAETKKNRSPFSPGGGGAPVSFFVGQVARRHVEVLVIRFRNDLYDWSRLPAEEFEADARADH
jgi:hypothetical protein